MLINLIKELHYYYFKNGSSFPKAKPKQSLVTVLRLAVLRLIFLPLYAKWWVEQTSPKVFSFLLFVYLVQMFNWGVYCTNIHRLGPDTEHIVSISELLIPLALSSILSIIHSQIVATSSNVNKSEKQRKLHLQPKRKKRERIKRKKKTIRLRSNLTTTEVRSSLNLDSSIQSPVTPQCSSTSCKKIIQINRQHLNTSNSTDNTLDSKCNIKCDNEVDINISKNKECSSSYTSKCYKIDQIIPSDLNLDTNEIHTNNIEIYEPSTTLRKRNVNWDSPIKSHLIVTSSEYSETNDSNDIDTNVQEFYNELIDKTEASVGNDGAGDSDHENINNNHNVSEQTGDDDGFESLNGKSSSGEENLNDRRNLLNTENINSVPSIKFHYRNTWIRENLENVLNKCTDSDTDTLKGNSSSIALKINTLASNSKAPITIKNNLKPGNLLATESDFNTEFNRKTKNNLIKAQQNFINTKDDSSDTDEENEDCETVSTPGTSSNPHFTEGTTSATEWIGVTTNSDECSYSSEIDHSDSQNELSENCLEYDIAPTVILNPPCGFGDRISCTIWDRRETKKAEMSVLDISSAIIEKVEAMPETCDYIYIGVIFSIILSFTPAFCRLCEITIDSTNSTEMNFFDMPIVLLEKASFSCTRILLFAFGNTQWERIVLTVSSLLRLCLTFLFFFLLAVAERTFKQRFLYAKLFSHLTSSRRARKSELPHFRLNKVRNIKTWLSVRSYLKRRGPQRSVDVIVSAAFILTLLLLAFLSVEWLKDSVHLHSQFNLEALVWSCALGIFLLRFMTLGTKINRKYRSISVLITEQINLYLQIEQKPHKKEELMVANSVLKLAADLLKELESPFKISGLSANPVLYTTVKVVILSALSGVLSEILGFKLKLHKIKIK